MAGLARPAPPARAQIREEIRELAEDLRLIRAREHELFWRLPDDHERLQLAKWRARHEARIAEAFRGRHA